MEKYIPIFPKIRIVNDMIETRVRVYHEGQWYLTIVREFYTMKHLMSLSSEAMSDIITRLNYNVYMTILFGKVDLNIVDQHDRPVFELDPDQRSEQKRMQDGVKIV